MQGLDGVPSYAELRSWASEAEVLGGCSGGLLEQGPRAMKRAADRSQHMVDLENLEAAEVEERTVDGSPR